MGAGCTRATTMLPEKTTDRNCSTVGEIADESSFSLYPLKDGKKNVIYVWFELNFSFYLSSLTLCLTIPKTKHTPKTRSGSSIFPWLKNQSHTTLCFWINNSFSQWSYETRFWVCMVLSALSSITAAQFEFWAVIISYLKTANESYKLHEYINIAL